MNEKLSSRHFDSDDHITAAVDSFLEAGLYKEVIHMLHDQWTKCATVGEDYSELKSAKSSQVDYFYLRPWTNQSLLGIPAVAHFDFHLIAF